MTLVRGILVAITVLVLVAGAAVVMLLSTDLGRFKGNVESYVSQATGRQFVIGGEFQPKFGKTLELLVEDVSFANAEWGEADNMLTADRVVISVDAWSLIDRPALVRNLEIDGLTVHVEANTETGRSAWDFSDRENEQDSGSAGFLDGGELPVVLQQARLSNVDINYGRGWLDAPRNVSIVKATISEGDDQLLALDLDGTLDGEELGASGKIGSLQALITGRNVQWDLELRLGEYRSSTVGSFRNLFKLTGPDISAQIKGPPAEAMLARLGLPPLARGPVDVAGTMRETDDGIEANIAGAFGDLKTNITGQANSLLEIRSGQLVLDVGGQNLQAIGELFEAGFLPPDSFTVKGTVSATDEALVLDDMTVVVGESLLNVDGKIGLSRDVVERQSELAVIATGPEIQRFVDPALEVTTPDGPFEFAAILAGNRRNLTLQKLNATIGEYQLQADGVVGDLANLDGLDLSVDAQGSDLQALLEPWLDIALPAEPFTIQGDIRHEASELQFSGITFRIADVSGTVDGTTGAMPDLDGLQLDLRINGPDASRLAGLLEGMEDVVKLPAEPFEYGGKLQRTGKVWSTDPWVVVIGDSRLEIRGSLGDGTSPDSIDLGVTASGPDLRKFLPGRGIATALPFKANGRIGVTTNLIDVKNLEVVFGDTSGFVNGRIPTTLELADAKFEIRLSGRDLRAAGQAFNVGGLPGGPFRFDGALSRQGSAYVVDRLSAALADNELTGNLTFEFEPKRKLTGRLESDALDLSEIFPGDDPEEKKEKTDDGRLIPDLPLPMQLLNVADMDLVVIARKLTTEQYDVGDMELLLVSGPDRFSIKTGDVTLKNGGNMSLSIDMERESETDARMRLELLGEQFNLKPPVDGGGAPINRPLADMKVSLSGSGSTLRELAASANGDISIRQGEGEIDNSLSGFLLRDIAKQVFGAINPFAKDTPRTNMQCGILAADVVDGVIRARVAGLQIDQLTAVSVGTVDLETEALDVSFRTKQREGVGFSLTTAVNPYIKLGGTLAKPSLQLDLKRGIVSGTVAVLTGGLSILAEGVWDRYLAADNFCNAVVEGLDSGEIGRWDEAQVESDEDGVLRFFRKSGQQILDKAGIGQ